VFGDTHIIFMPSAYSHTNSYTVLTHHIEEFRMLLRGCWRVE